MEKSEWFKEQSTVVKPLTDAQVAKIRGKTLFGSKPELNDKVYWLMILKEPKTELVECSLVYITEKQIDELDKKYRFVRSGRGIPYFQDRNDEVQHPVSA